MKRVALWLLAAVGALAIVHPQPAWTQDSAAAGAVKASAPPPAAPPPQWLYQLRVQPAFHDPKAWTAAANAAVSRHFERLKAATDTGQVILAGRTGEPLDSTFGLVVFEAPDEASARRFMEEDPAVVAGVMSATLHPYRVALMRANPPGPAQ